MRGIVRTAFGIALATGMSSAAAAETVAYVNGNWLWDQCTQQRGTESWGFCFGYIVGITDDLFTKNPVWNFRACFREGVTAEQARDVVVAWLQNNPQDRHKAASYLIAEALAHAFPCQ